MKYANEYDDYDIAEPFWDEETHIKGVCKSCDKSYSCDSIEDNFGTGLCHYCFEGALEEYEEHRRERIAIANEY
jgi:hypothetical protein